MKTFRICNFKSIDDQFNFGRYHGLSLADVLDINPSYLSWCVKHCTGIIFQLEDEVIEQIRIIYPKYIMDALFESNRIRNLNRTFYDEYDDDDYYEMTDDNSFYNDTQLYSRYAGTWAQDIENYSDDDIDTIFDGDPNAYWNID